MRAEAGMTPSRTEAAALGGNGKVLKEMKGKRMIGLTGGVGSGKSRILQLMEQEYGAGIIQTDLVAKRLEEPGQPGFIALVDGFGAGIVGEDGSLKKEVLARMVFEDRKSREKINGLIHPLVWKYVKRQAQNMEASVVVAESALLLENPDDFFDEIWYVYTAREERIRRLMEGRGYSEEKCRQMMAGQPSKEEYCRCADFVIDNNGSIEMVREQIGGRMEGLR